MRTTALALLFWLGCFIQVWAQPVWEGGIFIGGAAYQGDLLESLTPRPKDIGLSLGGFARFYFSPAWSLRTNLLYARYQGDDKEAESEERRQRGNRFDSRTSEFALLFEWDPLGKRRYPGGTEYRRTISPFFFTGFGLGYIDAKPEFGDQGGNFPQKVMKDLQADESVRFSIPGGFGLKWDLSRKSTLSAVVDVRYMFTDYLDGISYTANPNTNDWLWSGGLQYSLRFAPKDTDSDGIVDKEDSCPWVAGSPTAGGCPDMDGDGVEDAEDVCPEIPGLFANNGCPDRDGDGIMDLIDNCPDDYGYEDTGGCPDRDNDCVADAFDKCPDQEGPVWFDGCPDTDNDGFSDPLDPCPLDAGLAVNGGCPLPDSDCDGVIDQEDICPLLPGDEDMSGCPDTDQDGVTDNLDKCPDLPGDIDNDGCPDLEQEEKDLITNAKGSIRFKTGSAILLAESKDVLDDIVELMRKYPYYHLRIEGYTDDRGNDEANLVLSEKRAESCYQYFLYRGIGPVRMSHEGFGEGDPIGDNETEEGRRLNRRVEFEMYLPDKS